jgi:ATP-binding cassette subfamily B protein
MRTQAASIVACNLFTVETVRMNTLHVLFFIQFARQGATETGGITLLVSHRFSTVRTADLIVVLSGTHVAEVGSHRELIAQGGLYSELYEMQAASYR